MVTIITPTYNRVEGIKNLYKSLCDQTIKDFEWLIVDDGSTDETAEVVKSLIGMAEFRIRYLFKKNGGKHTALNLGISTIKSTLTFIVDSDDIVTKDAVETILFYHDNYKDRQEICGYTFLRQFPDGNINGKLFETDQLVDSYINTRINADDTMADKAEVFKTSCLIEFPFPEYPGECFLGEDLVWIRMARKYKMVNINKAIYIGSYQQDGLTQNRRKHNIMSPVGCMHRAEEFIYNDIRLKYQIKGELQYIIYGKFAGYSAGKLMKYGKSKLMLVGCYPLGLLIYCKWKRKYLN